MHIISSQAMKTKQISNRVHFIGVNDRTSEKFEALWPLPNGVSYNSYLVVGNDKTAIIDGVDCTRALQQIDHIAVILGDRRPDYLVINHMEPDHSGAIRVLRQAYPELTIVGNAQTLSMVKGFYGEEGNTLTVKEGDTLALDEETTLRFVLTPMVHWPETMMTYFEQEKMLFSGDAFGCFGALNGAVVDTEMETGLYFDEMVRYYSNIVGKYGRFVQRALAKIKNIELSAICPTHGPVWTAEHTKVVDLYDRLSRFEPLDNGVTIVYGSMYGNTEQMVETAAEALAEAGVKYIRVFNAARTDQSYMISEAFRHRGLIIASPTYSETLFPPVAGFVKAIAIRGLQNREVVFLGSHTWAQQAVKEMAALLQPCGIEPIVAPVVAKQAPDDAVLDACREAARALAEKLA